MHRNDVAAGLTDATAVADADAAVGVADAGDEPGPRVAPPAEAPLEEAAVVVTGAAAPQPPTSVVTRSAARKAGRNRTVVLRSRRVGVVTAASLRS